MASALRRTQRGAAAAACPHRAGDYGDPTEALMSKKKPQLPAHGNYLNVPKLHNKAGSTAAAPKDVIFLHEREESEMPSVLEVASEFPAIELELNSEYPGLFEHETVT